MEMSKLSQDKAESYASHHKKTCKDFFQKDIRKKMSHLWTKHILDTIHADVLDL